MSDNDQAVGIFAPPLWPVRTAVAWIVQSVFGIDCNAHGKWVLFGLKEFSASEAMLLDAFIDGRVIPEGINSNTNKRERIPLIDWADIGLSPDDRLEYRATILPESGRSNRITWTRLRVNAEDIKALRWSAAGRPKRVQKSKTVPKEKLVTYANLAFTYAQQRQWLPPTHGEMVDILRKTLGASRDTVRLGLRTMLADNVFPKSTGPRGPRNPGREAELNELREYLGSAELQD